MSFDTTTVTLDSLLSPFQESGKRMHCGISLLNVNVMFGSNCDHLSVLFTTASLLEQPNDLFVATDISYDGLSQTSELSLVTQTEAVIFSTQNISIFLWKQVYILRLLD